VTWFADVKALVPETSNNQLEATVMVDAPALWPYVLPVVRSAAFSVPRLASMRSARAEPENLTT